ncbi:solute carrier family 22 member 7 isoform X2 [Esox lucius]|uniref:solute carrier family 22 member 7 isoform X2 n=1 Tax=Esox lucius TaxID=8010 RepID=UPI0009733E9B|nr:solute carrier family 22 member 7 isoform X2 [Esox lucius]
MKFENILEETDGCGWFQILIITLLCVPRVILPFNFLLHNFIAAVPAHHCALDDAGVIRNLTQEQRLTVSVPVEEDGTPSSCKMFLEPQFHLLINPNDSDLVKVPCQNGWVYDNSTFKSTIATEWDLVCNRTAMNKVTATIFFVGVMMGAIAFGTLSDKWLPESARWLIANGEVEKAHLYLQKCAYFNNKKDFLSKIKPEDLSNVVVVDKSNKTYSYLDLVRTPKMRRLALLTGIVWYGVASTYYGISLNITGFGLSVYLTHFIFSAIEIPAKIIVYFCLDTFGRKLCQASTLLLAGTCIAINMFVPKGQWHLRTIVAVLGKGLSEASFTTVILHTTEIYPTVVRQNGLGYTNFMARLGVSIAPLIILLEEVWKPLPEVIICCVSILSGLVAFLLPETHNVRLPETIEDIEKTSDHQAKDIPLQEDRTTQQTT